MINEKRLIKLIESIRTNPFLEKYQEILERDPEIKVSLINNSLELLEIDFPDYDEITIFSKGIYLIPEHGKSKQILKCDGWEEIYKIFGV